MREWGVPGGRPAYPWCPCIYVTGMKFGLRKRWQGWDVAYSNWGFWWWCQQMCRWTMAFPLVHAQWFSCWKNRADDHDVIEWHHNDLSCSQGREVYKESTHKPQGCHLGFWYWMVGSINKSQTLYSSYIGASCGAEYSQNELCTLFINMHVPRTFWELFSQYDLSCLMLVR